MNTTISDSLKSQSNRALAIFAVSASALVSSLTANVYEFAAILVLCISSLALFAYSTGLHSYLKKVRRHLAGQQIESAMETHTSFPLTTTTAISLFLLTVMVVRTHYALGPIYVDIVFTVSVFAFVAALTNSAFINLFKVLLINHRLLITTEAV